MLNKNGGGVLGTVGKLALTVAVVSTIGVIAARTKREVNDLYVSTETRIFDKDSPYAYSEMLEFAESLRSSEETAHERLHLSSADEVSDTDTGITANADTGIFTESDSDADTFVISGTVTESSGVIDDAESAEEEPLEVVVYWVKNGDVWHLSEKCPSLSRSKSILKGTVDDAIQSGKARVCKRCGG